MSGHKLLTLPWKVWTRQNSRECGAYVIASFPNDDSLTPGRNIVVGYPRNPDASIYTPALGVGGVDEADLEKAFHTMAAAPFLLRAAQNTIKYYHRIMPERACLCDGLYPCYLSRDQNAGIVNWDGGPGCPLCSARAAIAKAEGVA